jgi:TPR repeat protein
MPVYLVCCITLPPATIQSVPIFDFADANEELAFTTMETEEYYSCCGKSICRGCIHSFGMTGNNGKCPFCKAEKVSKTYAESVAEMMKRVEAQDAGAMNQLAQNYYFGGSDLQQDHAKAMELWKQAVALGSSQAHFYLAEAYHHDLEDLKKAQFHYEAAAVAGHEVARCNLAIMEKESGSGNIERVLKHLRIAASAGNYAAMNFIRKFFEKGVVSRESIDSTLTAYNNSCAEMRSEARDAYLSIIMAMHESTNNS